MAINNLYSLICLRYYITLFNHKKKIIRFSIKIKANGVIKTDRYGMIIYVRNLTGIVYFLDSATEREKHSISVDQHSIQLYVTIRSQSI